jgi:hypothetical protein
MVSDESGRWIHFCLNSTSSARHPIFVRWWRAHQFLKWVFCIAMHFRLVVSGVLNQHFREFHLENAESGRWCPHFCCWDRQPELKSLPNDRPMCHRRNPGPIQNCIASHPNSTVNLLNASLDSHTPRSSMAIHASSSVCGSPRGDAGAGEASQGPRNPAPLST